MALPKEKIQYHIEPRGMTLIAAGFMVLSFLLRLAWCILWPENIAGSLLFTRAILPLSACTGFVFCLLRRGEDSLRASFVPALMGVLFFILKAGTFVWWHQLLCTLLYLLVAVLYGLTVLGICPIRKLLYPLFGLPLAFHIFVEDLIINRNVYTLSQWFQEWSVLCIMAGLLCLAAAIREAPPAPEDISGGE